MSEKTPEAYEVDEMLDLDAKVILILFWLVNIISLCTLNENTKRIN